MGEGAAILPLDDPDGIQDIKRGAARNERKEYLVYDQRDLPELE